MNLAGEDKNISDFATGYLYFGLHRTARWLGISGMGSQCDQHVSCGRFQQLEGDRREYRLSRLENDVWELELNEDKMKQGDLFKISVHWNGGHGHQVAFLCKPGNTA